MILRLALVCILLAGAAACGKKPGTLSPPPGDDAREYPRIYPTS
jgi:predicted small lipoprotein YifL